MDNVIGFICPANQYDIYHSISIARQLEDETDKKWSFIIKNGRLIYTIDYARMASESELTKLQDKIRDVYKD